MRALIVIDMLEDFVTGVLADERQAGAIVPAIRAPIEHARTRPDWLVVHSNHVHEEGTPEIAVRGRHATAGTPGARVIEALRPAGGEREVVSPKRHYGAFDGTGLDEVLRRRGVASVVSAGQHTHCCVRHTAYGAFVHALAVEVPEDAVCVFDGVDQAAALDYPRRMYGATITTSTALTGAAADPAEAAR